MTHPEAAARAASRAPRWRPDTPLRALLLGAGIVLLLEGIHLLVTLVFVDVPDSGWFLERGNYRVGVIVSVLTGFAAASLWYSRLSERRDLEALGHALGWSEEQLGAILAPWLPRPRVAFAWALAFAPTGLLLVTSNDTSRPFVLTGDPWTASIAWAMGANFLLFALIGAIAYVTWLRSRIDRALDAQPRPLELLDTAAERRMAASGLRRSFFWLVGSSLASLVLVDLDFSWMTALVVVVTLAVGTTLFLSPLLKLARRVRAAKEGELARVRLRIRAARDLLLAAPDPGSAASELSALLAYEKRIEAVRPFALDAFQALRFGMLVVLAIGSWLGGAIAEQVVGRFLR